MVAIKHLATFTVKNRESEYMHALSSFLSFYPGPSLGSDAGHGLLTSVNILEITLTDLPTGQLNIDSPSSRLK